MELTAEVDNNVSNRRSAEALQCHAARSLQIVGKFILVERFADSDSSVQGVLAGVELLMSDVSDGFLLLILIT